MSQKRLFCPGIVPFKKDELGGCHHHFEQIQNLEAFGARNSKFGGIWPVGNVEQKEMRNSLLFSDTTGGDTMYKYRN